MLCHVWASSRRTLGGRCSTLTSRFPLVSCNKRDKTMRSYFSLKTLIDPLREVVKPLNTEAINTLLIRELFKKELRVQMSIASGPQRNEVLESNVGEMKMELSHTRTQIEQMMGMVQQLLQAKSADRDQQKEESGAGRAPCEGGATGARIGATTATAAGGRVSNHSNKALVGSRPADDKGMRPEVPAGVDPMINLQRGETKS